MPRSLAAALTLAAVLTTTAAWALEVAASKVYRGTDGQSVEVLTLEPRTSDEALVRVRGTDSHDDGITLKCAVRKSSRGADYVTRHGGGEYVVLVQRDGAHEAFLPGVPGFRVKFSQEATDKLVPGDVLAAYQQQSESGRVAAFQKKPWPYLEKKYTTRATEAVAALQKRCGVAPTFTFDWKTFGDAQMAELDVWAACAPLATQAAKHCDAVKGATALVCRFGPALGFERQGDTLTFTTTARGAADGPALIDRKLSP
jgi:hypothetical protein